VLDDDEYVGVSVNGDLDRLIALLTLENEELQAEQAQNRLRELADQIEAKHDRIIKQIEKSVELAVKQAKKQRISKIFGWIGAAIALAVSIAVTILTLGALSPTIGACVSAICGLVAATATMTVQIMNETGAMEKLRNKAAESYMKKNVHLSKEEAKAEFDKKFAIGFGIAQFILAAASFGFSFTGGVGIGVQVLQQVGGALNALVGVGSTVLNWMSTFENKKAAELRAQLKMFQKSYDLVKEQLEQDQDILQEILEQIQTQISNVALLLSARDEVAEEILGNFEAKA